MKIAIPLMLCFFVVSYAFGQGKNAQKSMKFVADMGVGWNLGNTFDTKDKDQTKWGNPIPTRELISAVRAKGFKTLRVPVTWQYHMGPAPDYTIEKEWFDRVEKIVKEGLDNGMYVIVNVHHDEEWVIPAYAEVDRAKNQLAKVWAQIAERFKKYDNHLIFETLNETRMKGSKEEWTGGTPEGRDCINQLHAAAVKAIRASGGKNKTRYIMISTYAANPSKVAIDDLKLPDDNYLIASIHNYFPYKFCLAREDYRASWGSEEDRAALDAELDRLVESFIKKGIPVVKGEWGSLNHDNTEARVKHAEYYAKECVKRGICPVWWDNGNTKDFGLIDRKTNKWVYPEIADAIVRAARKK